MMLLQQSLLTNRENLLPFKGEVLLFPNAFASGESSIYFTHLVNEINWRHEAIKMFGKEVMQPRLTAWYGDEGKSYSYSGITMHPLDWTPALLQIKHRAEELSGACFNSALLNYYRDGNDSMGWHRDDEKELGINPVIASVSFGASRKFQFRYYADKSVVRDIELTHGSLLLMCGETQHYWQHRLPKTKNKTARINITFRVIM